MSGKQILIYPACEAGRGSGHIMRCIHLAEELHARNRDAFLFLADNEKTKSLVQNTRFNPERIITDYAQAADKDWECIVFDRFRTPPAEFSQWKGKAALIGIDEGGPCRAHFDFLFDILPGIARAGSGRAAPNISDPSLLFLPQKKERETRRVGAPLKILISFGQEDSAGLACSTAQALAHKNADGLLDITLLSGLCSAAKTAGTASVKALSDASSIKILESIPNLAEHLCEYDLLVTHYGITAFEALYAGTPVILASPGAYHEKLAGSAGFCSVGIGKRNAAKIARLLFPHKRPDNIFLQKLNEQCSALAQKYKLVQQSENSLAALIDKCAPTVSASCTVCGALHNDSFIGRFSDRSYFRCPSCGIISMNRLTPPPFEYDKEYFFESYKKQYGKTYLDDFPNLIAMAKKRLAVICKLGSRESGVGSLLDIGCAYGPFLAASREAGFSPFGIDPSDDAVNYVTQTLGIPAVQGFFPAPHLQVPTPHYDAITLWYVIEHFNNCNKALAEIKKILKPGGILAFSTPSFSGISGRSSLRHFLENSPADHWAIWSPSTCIKALKKYGFTVKKIICTGHHPERFPFAGKLACSKRSPLYKILMVISKIFLLGDTFEVYAVSDRV